ncbi:hypothetical protein BG000_003263 [Podila horticola]|nr:hypothetical protein BG000_003263 [Podila horticola]
MSSRAGTPTGAPPPPYPAKSPVAAALSSQNTPSSSRAQSLHSSVSHQSTFSAADAARHLSQEHVAKTSQEMFRKISDYVKSEMLATGEDYKLLENMNIVTKERYGEMAIMAQELMQEVGKLRTTCKTPVLDSFDFHGPASFFSQLAMYNVLSYLDSDFEPYLARIDEISQQADIISNVASELDEYTKALGK